MTPATKTASTIKQQTNKRRHYRARTKARAIALKGGQCQRCGFADERALHFHHNEPLRRGRNGLSKKAMTSTESHRAVVRGDGKGLSLLCSNCIAIMNALDWTLNINTPTSRDDGECERGSASVRHKVLWSTEEVGGTRDGTT